MYYCRYVVWDRNVGFPITWVIAETDLPEDWVEVWYKRSTTKVRDVSLLEWEEITKETYHIIAKSWPEIVLQPEFLPHDFSHLNGVDNGRDFIETPQREQLVRGSVVGRQFATNWTFEDPVVVPPQTDNPELR